MGRDGRFTRNEFLKVRNLDYVTAATAIGLPDRRIMFRHILPNAGPSAGVGGAGHRLGHSCGIRPCFFASAYPPTPSPGDRSSTKPAVIPSAWWLAVFPGAAIFVAVISYYMVGEGLRDALDPRLK